MKIGIALGTANVLVYLKGKGVVITEPSVVAVSDVEGVRHGLDAGDVDRAHLLDEREHAVQALEHLRGFLCRDRNAGQRGNPAHVVVG